VEHEQKLREFAINSVKEIGLTLEQIHVEQFMRYLAHLIDWNKTINLTAIVDSKEIIIKHFVDSLGALVATNFPRNSVILDVGSGGGFPGIPLKIFRSDINLILVEPIQKKCSFLNSVTGLLKLQCVSVFNGTIEQYTMQPIRQVIDTIVIRALKYKKISKHVSALLAPNGKVVLYRTATIENDEIGKEFHLLREVALILPQVSGKRIISVIEKNPIA
jgi:16S rRNA (guanine527-N7)-methyltransferase